MKITERLLVYYGRFENKTRIEKHFITQYMNPVEQKKTPYTFEPFFSCHYFAVERQQGPLVEISIKPEFVK